MTPFDPLDMRNYRMEQLPKREKGKFASRVAAAGPFLAVAAFLLFAFGFEIPFLQNIDAATLSSSSAKAAYAKLGAAAFTRSNEMMLAIFVVSFILWGTEALPNYLTGLIVLIALVLTGVLPEKEAYAQLGHPVMWLNIMSFVLASMLVTTGVAKRLALGFLLRFGKNANRVFLSFIFINLVLSAVISSTIAKAAILLPIFMVIAAIYGARGGEEKTNFGRSIVLQNLLCINIGASAFMTGSGANLLGAALIGGAIGTRVYYSDWIVAMMPVSITMMLLSYLVAARLFFPLKPEERMPQIQGGMERLRQEYRSLGPLSRQEIKAVVLFLLILGFWATERMHHVSATAVAFVGAIIALLPGIGIIKWNDVDIPWHLMLFSAGAYALGAGLDVTDLSFLSVNAFFNHVGIGDQTPFWVLYLLLTGVMIFSAIAFESKTMRCMIFVPIAIGTANRFGLNIASLALPVVFLIEHVDVLPFNSKPAALLYETDRYSLGDAIKFGLVMMLITWLVFIVAGETWFRFLGITPKGVFGLF
ncbi:MAG TPA: SLC13 family permease [bacterium]|nr:SLC13 family permease [bacterium]HQG44061.1 SLC13 family permease [bacterium]HQJ65220.1 SLC13 family permease [bacterium]